MVLAVTCDNEGFDSARSALCMMWSRCLCACMAVTQTHAGGHDGFLCEVDQSCSAVSCDVEVPCCTQCVRYRVVYIINDGEAMPKKCVYSHPCMCCTDRRHNKKFTSSSFMFIGVVDYEARRNRTARTIHDIAL